MLVEEGSKMNCLHGYRHLSIKLCPFGARVLGLALTFTSSILFNWSDNSSVDYGNGHRVMIDKGNQQSYPLGCTG